MDPGLWMVPFGLTSFYIGSGQLPIVGRNMGSGQLPIAWGALIGSGQLPIATVEDSTGAADTTAGAANAKATAPAMATEAAIFFNMDVPQYELDSLQSLRSAC